MTRQHAYTGPAIPQMPEPSHAERVRTPVSRTTVATLSTLSRKHAGFTFGSLMPYALDSEAECVPRPQETKGWPPVAAIVPLCGGSSQGFQESSGDLSPIRKLPINGVRGDQPSNCVLPPDRNKLR
jgi:hypothetical protein